MDETTVQWIASLFIERLGGEAQSWAEECRALHQRNGHESAAAGWRRVAAEIEGILARREPQAAE